MIYSIFADYPFSWHLGDGIELHEHDGHQWNVLKNIVIEQWTGLTDKNGREIYDGDVVRITDLMALECCGGPDSPLMKEYTRDWVVEWGGIGYKARYYDSKSAYDPEIVFDLPTKNVEIEVIGNIHEEGI